MLRAIPRFRFFFEESIFHTSKSSQQNRQVFMATFQCDSFLAAAETAIEESTQQEQHAQDCGRDFLRCPRAGVVHIAVGKWAPKNISKYKVQVSFYNSTSNRSEITQSHI